MKRNSGVTWRAVIIGFLLILPISYWSIRRGTTWSGPPDMLSLHYNVVFTIFFFSLLNILLLKRFIKKFALTQREILVIYIMLSLVTAIGGFDRLQTILVLLGQISWFSTPENEWKEIFSPYIKKWLVVTDKKALKGFYENESTFYVAEHIKAWLIPVLIWSLFLSVLIFVMLCISVILRKQWVEREKLNYPIIQIPVAMTKSGGARDFFANKGFWIAFAAAAFVDIFNTLSINFPVLPRLPTRGAGFRFAEKPWNAMGWTMVDFTPFNFAFGFLMPLDLNFSLWFLFLFWKLMRVFLTITGWRLTGTYMPGDTLQVSGGCIGLGAIALWKTRRHISDAVKRIFTREHSEDPTEPIKYKWAFLGMIMGIVSLFLFFYKTGIPVWVAIVFWGIHFIISIAVTRMRAELGPPFHELLHSGADRVLISTFGGKGLGNSTLTMFIPLSGITDRQRAHTMPYQLEGFKIAQKTGINNKRLFFVMIASSVFGAFLSSWLILHSVYEHGTAQAGGFGRWAVVPIKNLIINPAPPNQPDMFAIGFGFVFTLLLSFMRRFLWWPIHPLAYPLSLVDWGIRTMWFPFVISWIFKKNILRYGGAKLYRQAIPIFSGLLLGEFVIGGLLTIINIAFNIPVYMFIH